LNYLSECASWGKKEKEKFAPSAFSIEQANPQTSQANHLTPKRQQSTHPQTNNQSINQPCRYFDRVRQIQISGTRHSGVHFNPQSSLWFPDLRWFFVEALCCLSLMRSSRALPCSCTTRALVSGEVSPGTSAARSSIAWSLAKHSFRFCSCVRCVSDTITNSPTLLILPRSYIVKSRPASGQHEGVCLVKQAECLQGKVATAQSTISTSRRRTYGRIQSALSTSNLENERETTRMPCHSNPSKKKVEREREERAKTEDLPWCSL